MVSRGRFGPDVLRLPSTRGDLLFIASTLNWAVYSVLGHSTLRRLGPVRATAGAMLAGSFLLLPLWLAQQAWKDYARLSASGWAALLFLGLACSGLGYLFWYAALQRLEASRVTAFVYLEPLVTCVAAVVWLGEEMSAQTLVGGALLLAGLMSYRGRRNGPPRRRCGVPDARSRFGGFLGYRAGIVRIAYALAA